MTSRKILIGLTGGIACYKIPVLVRRLKEAGHEVRIVMSASSLNFITELTLQAISGYPVATSLMDETQEAAMGHIALARWADLILVAPATAHFMAQLAHGLSGDLLTTICLATTAPIALAPAMNQQMWLNEATRYNFNLLVQRGFHIWGPAMGLQACGENGPGRMLEPEALAEYIDRYFSNASSVISDTTNETIRHSLLGVSVVITAGPTVEDLDPVRYISNRSSGKMGFALAAAAANSGAKVTLIAGPVSLPTPSTTGHEPIKRIDVRSAKDMFAAVMRESCDLFIGAAAVSDYRPKEVSPQKLKKLIISEARVESGSAIVDSVVTRGFADQGAIESESKSLSELGEEFTLTLVKNPDIIRWVANQAKRPFSVGFAAETENAIEYGLAKLKAKNLDMIAINSVLEPGVGFDVDTNAITLVWKDGKTSFPVQSKDKLAEKLIKCIKEKFYEEHSVKNSG